MRRIRILAHRLRSVLQRRRQEVELAHEIELHLEQLRRELIAEGMSEKEAEREARRQFGPVDITKEQCRDTRRVRLLEDVFRDVQFALRLFWKSPGFTLTALISLILGIGANAAMFQLFDAVRLRSLPVEKPEELVLIRIRGEGRNGNFRGRNSQFTYALWDELRRGQKAFSGIFAYGDTPVNLSPAGEVRNVEGLWVSGSLFPTLGVRPQLGRLLTPEDDRPGCGWPGVVISHAFWLREFGGDMAVLSRTLPIDGRTVPILGVTPPEFYGLEVGRRFDVAMPVCSAPEEYLKNRAFWFLTVMARLRPDVTTAAARAELQAMSAGVFEATLPDLQPHHQTLYRAMQFDLEAGASGQSPFRETVQLPLLILQSMVGLILLLACANLANMMLARATAREHEFAVRRSLGASRWRLIRQVLIESSLLAFTGALIGAMAAPTVGRGIVTMLSTAREPIHLALDWNGRVFGLATVAALFATILFGLAPALHAGRADTRGTSASREKIVFRRVLLAVQVALCTILLSSALLFSRSLHNMLTFSPGFNPHGILVANIFLDQKHPPERRAVMIDELQRRVNALPGVSASARSSVIPISGSGWDRCVPQDSSHPQVCVNLMSVSEGYFQVMNTPLLAGRDFNSADRPSTTQVAIVSQSFARALFGAQNPIGKTIRFDGPEPPYEIVGLVADSKYRTLAENTTPIAYFADTQKRVADTRMRLLVRTSGQPESLIEPIKRSLLEADPTLTMRFVPLQSQIEESVLRERLMAVLSGGFGLLGAVLALTGVFGVTAYVVSRRYREFGVRIALGATGGGIVRIILQELMLTQAIGVLLGSLIAIGTGSIASSVLYGVSPKDPSMLATVILLLAIGGFAAGLIPALRAARVEPVEALRVE